MACSLLQQHLVLLLNLVSIFHLHNALILPVTRDVATHQYITRIHHGTPLFPIKLVVDLNGPFIWSDCSSRHLSSSHRPVHFPSLHCSTAKAHGPGNVTCGLSLENPITTTTTWVDPVEDIVAVNYVDRSTVHQMLYYCTPTLFLKGLASGTNGMLGLGRTRMTVQSQLAMSYGLDRKFAICLSSSNGFINFGGGSQIDILKSLMYTPLVNNKGRNGIGTKEYFINVKSVKINGKRIPLLMDRRGDLGTKISTIVPYTTMESSIYDIFTKAYVKFATSMNMTRVANVGAPFRVCFSSKNIGSTPVGPVVPTIDLVLQSEMVKWRIYGRNSMVQVSDEVMCLGFLDGGSNPRSSIVIGGHQLEDNLLQFDLATSMLGFSSSLLAKGTTCSITPLLKS